MSDTTERSDVVLVYEDRAEPERSDAERSDAEPEAKRPLDADGVYLTNGRETWRVGRPRNYTTEEEKAEAQRKNALLHYHRKKALAAYLKDNHEMSNGDIITVHVKVNSRRLGEIEESVHYRVINKDKELFQKVN